MLLGSLLNVIGLLVFWEETQTTNQVSVLKIETFFFLLFSGFLKKDSDNQVLVFKIETLFLGFCLYSFSCSVFSQLSLSQVLSFMKMTVESQSGEDGAFDRFPVGMRVLAVDDDPICLKVLETLLRKCQYQGLFPFPSLISYWGWILILIVNFLTFLGGVKVKYYFSSEFSVHSLYNPILSFLFHFIQYGIFCI